MTYCSTCSLKMTFFLRCIDIENVRLKISPVLFNGCFCFNVESSSEDLVLRILLGGERAVMHVLCFLVERLPFHAEFVVSWNDDFFVSFGTKSVFDDLDFERDNACHTYYS